MKFGRELPRNMVPEWRTHYINYKGLKKLIKAAASEEPTNEPADTAEFFFSLDRNLEDVDQFYNRKFSEVSRKLKLLRDQYGKSLEETPVEIDSDEAEDLVGALLEIRDALRKLTWYGETNRRGFVKITKKLDKKVPNHNQRQYVESVVDLKPFASDKETKELLNTTNDWIEKANSVKHSQQAQQQTSGSSIPKFSAKSALNFPQALLDIIDRAIRDDNAEKLSQYMTMAGKDVNEGLDDPRLQRLLLNLLQRAIVCRSKECMAKLLPSIKSLDEIDDINNRNCIHRLVISVSRTKQTEEYEKSEANSEEGGDDELPGGNYITPAAPPLLSIPLRNKKEMDIVDGSEGQEDQAVSLLSFLLDKLTPEQRPALKAVDGTGRIPLHYAAQYGFVAICQILLARMQAWNIFEVHTDIDAPFVLDNDNLSPLHLSVMGGHYQTTKSLLEAEEWLKDHKAAFRKHMQRSGEVLAAATQGNYVKIVKLLVSAGIDINYKDDSGETALHVAARYGYDECAQTLLEGCGDEKANTEIAEASFGWTPLIIACVDGYLKVVELLIEAGADLEYVDDSGWTGKEHAALRGHLEIATELAKHTPAAPESGSSQSPSSPVRKGSLTNNSLTDRKSAVSNKKQYKTTPPVKAFGHRYLTDKAMVMVSLGTIDNRKSIDPVNLDRIPLAEAHLTQLDTALSLVVHASGAEGEPAIIDLPAQESLSTEPICFMTKDPSKVKLLFDIVPTYAGSGKDKIVGRAVALLSSMTQSLGSNRKSLQGDLSVPIMASRNMDVIGSVHFNFLIVTPFTHPTMSVAQGQTYWKSMSTTMLIGHRGLGKNIAKQKSLQLGENTIPSFVAAANLGATYVEFDVQITKDNIPVIYHDFLVSETGVDAPVHTLTLEQFLHVSEGGQRQSRPTTPSFGNGNTNKMQQDFRKHRSMSVGTYQEPIEEMNERMKHTRDFKAKGFKGNSRGNFIQSPFATLEQMFTQLPEHVGFNIEMKYPMLFESEAEEMDTYAVEVNSFVDIVLKKVYDLAKGRNIIFSSFNPDICLLLSYKQPSIPILFLTDAGTSEVGDIRASSLQEAIRFASRWNLLGVVSAAEPLVLCPRLVKVVKESGLVCVSYGTLNNSPENVQIQASEGIDAVIVDSVLAIRKGLQGGASHKEEHKEEIEHPKPQKPGDLVATNIANLEAGSVGPGGTSPLPVPNKAKPLETS